MNLLEASRVALVSLQANKMRSALTMLGIFIGVVAVIVMIGIGRGASADVQDRIRAMGTNLLIVWPGWRASSGRRSPLGWPKATRWSWAPARAAWAPEAQGGSPMPAHR